MYVCMTILVVVSVTRCLNTHIHTLNYYMQPGYRQCHGMFYLQPNLICVCVCVCVCVYIYTYLSYTHTHPATRIHKCIYICIYNDPGYSDCHVMLYLQPNIIYIQITYEYITILGVVIVTSCFTCSLTSFIYRLHTYIYT